MLLGCVIGVCYWGVLLGFVETWRGQGQPCPAARLAQGVSAASQRSVRLAEGSAERKRNLRTGTCSNTQLARGISHNYRVLQAF